MVASLANYDIPIDRVRSWESRAVVPHANCDVPSLVDEMVGPLVQDWTGGADSVEGVVAQRDDADEVPPVDSPPGVGLPDGDWSFGLLRWRHRNGKERSHYGWWRSVHGTSLHCDGHITVAGSRVISWQPLEIVPRDSFIELSDMYAGTTSSRTKGVRDFLNDVHGTALHHAPEVPF